MLSHVIAQRIVVTWLHVVTTSGRSHLKMHLLSIVRSVLLIILQTRLRLRKHICIDAIVTVTCTTVHTKTIRKLMRRSIATLVLLLPSLKHRLIADHHPPLHRRRTALMILMQVAARVASVLLSALPRARATTTTMQRVVLAHILTGTLHLAHLRLGLLRSWLLGWLRW